MGESEESLNRSADANFVEGVDQMVEKRSKGVCAGSERCVLASRHNMQRRLGWGSHLLQIRRLLHEDRGCEAVHRSSEGED